MPNTIAHFAVNGLISRKLIKSASLPLVYLGCIAPDLPWILQRAVMKVVPEVDRYDLRLYCVNQSSLFVTLFVCAAVAAVMNRWKPAFLTLALGSLLHLLLDACQIKWANGIGLFVPFDWQLIRFDLFWPESPWTVALTVAGLVYYLWRFPAASKERIEWSRRPARWALAIGCLALYVTLPLPWMDEAARENNHYVTTFHPAHAEERIGRPVEFDRERFRPGEGGEGKLRNFGAESFIAEGIDLEKESKVSARGRFVAEDRVVIETYHVHHGWLRDMATYAGLLMIAIVWILALRPAGTEAATP